MSPNTPAPSTASPWADRWQRAIAALLRGFHGYASWLVSISWKRFFLLSILLMIIAGITQSLPPFRWRVTETVDAPAHQRPSSSADRPLIKIEKPKKDGRETDSIDISIDERGIRITPRQAAPEAPAASAASAPVPAPSAPVVTPAPSASVPSISIDLPRGAGREAVRDAIEQARQSAKEAIADHRGAAADAEQAVRDAQQAIREAQEDVRRAVEDAALPGVTRKVRRTRTVHWGDFLTDLALIWIIASIIIKITYKGRIQAEAKAAQATETADAESLKRQVIEARMAAMQAQVEPHFLFNTLASIDHLIETDPPRASQMQKHLIALLRASMPTMREANANGVRDLGRELEVIRPYLEILKVRMEERLMTAIDVPEGLLSAEFPPMMIQSLVENAIKHGLEPKAEGGLLSLKAEVLHGDLAVTVADTGLGFGQAATAGTGVGLANIRERLQLLYGGKAKLIVAENTGGGTRVTITVPYRPIGSANA